MGWSSKLKLLIFQWAIKRKDASEKCAKYQSGNI